MDVLELVDGVGMDGSHFRARAKGGGGGGLILLASPCLKMRLRCMSLVIARRRPDQTRPDPRLNTKEHKTKSLSNSLPRARSVCSASCVRAASPTTIAVFSISYESIVEDLLLCSISISETSTPMTGAIDFVLLSLTWNE